MLIFYYSFENTLSTQALLLVQIVAFSYGVLSTVLITLSPIVLALRRLAKQAKKEREGLFRRKKLLSLFWLRHFLARVLFFGVCFDCIGWIQLVLFFFSFLFLLIVWFFHCVSLHSLHSFFLFFIFLFILFVVFTCLFDFIFSLPKIAHHRHNDFSTGGSTQFLNTGTPNRHGRRGSYVCVCACVCVWCLFIFLSMCLFISLSFFPNTQISTHTHIKNESSV